MLNYGFLPVPASLFLLSAAMYAAVIQHFTKLHPLENEGEEFSQTAVNQMCTLQRKMGWAAQASNFFRNLQTL
jgi:hypothetical protein